MAEEVAVSQAEQRMKDGSGAGQYRLLSTICLEFGLHQKNYSSLQAYIEYITLSFIATQRNSYSQFNADEQILSPAVDCTTVGWTIMGATTVAARSLGMGKRVLSSCLSFPRNGMPFEAMQPLSPSPLYVPKDASLMQPLHDSGDGHHDWRGLPAQLRNVPKEPIQVRRTPSLGI